MVDRGTALLKHVTEGLAMDVVSGRGGKGY